MLALGLLLAVLSALVGPGSSPVFMVTAFVVLAGLLYLLSSRFDRPSVGSRHTTPGRPDAAPRTSRRRIATRP
jgi:hypothetical protein